MYTHSQSAQGIWYTALFSYTLVVAPSFVPGLHGASQCEGWPNPQWPTCPFNLLTGDSDVEDV